MNDVKKIVYKPTEALERLREFDESMKLIRKYTSPQIIVPESDTKWEWYDTSSIRILYQ